MASSCRWSSGGRSTSPSSLFFGGVFRSRSEDSDYLFPFYSRSHQKLKFVPEARPPEADLVPTDERRFRLLLFLYDSISHPVDDGTRYSRQRVLWRLWHDETLGERRAVDVFPFFTYDRDGDDEITWSWLYKLLRYERRGGEKSLNVFFLPAIRWGAA